MDIDLPTQNTVKEAMEDVAEYIGERVSEKEDIFRYDTMPTASADYVGKIVQYTGATGTYTNGYFYKCTAQGTEPETYAWEESPTQSPISTPVMRGATIYQRGTTGTVPTPEIDDRNKTLFGDGTWRNIYSANQGSTVVVKCDSSASTVKGKTCTLTDGRTTLTATIDSASGEAVFTNVVMFGGVTATATNDNDDVAMGVGNITYFGQYLISLSMDYSVINITTADSALFGQSVSVYKDGAQLSSVAFNVAGQLSMSVGETGTYVFKTQVGKKFAKKTINVEALQRTYAGTMTLTTLFAVEYDEANSDVDSCTYPSGYSNSDFDDYAYFDLTNGVFHWGDWDDALASFLIPKSCMLKSDGIVDYYLDENHNKLKLDGTSSDNGDLAYEGNAMMEWAQNGKKIYWTVMPLADGKWRWVVGDGDYDGELTAWNHYDCNGNLANHFYMAKYKNSYVSSGKARSMTGYQPSASATAQNEVTYARANNSGNDVIWDTGTYVDCFFLQMMCVLFSKSLATQVKFGRGFVDYSWNNRNDAKTSGGMDDKGLFWGDTLGGNSTLGVKVFGIEHPWGNGWSRIRGLINANGTIKIKLTHGTQDGSTVSDYNFDGTGYISVGSIGGTSGGYISKMNITSKGLTPKTVSGSDSTYYEDGAWFNNGQNNYAYVGGYWYVGSLCGAFCVSLSNASSLAVAHIAAALSCKPLGEGA